MRILKQSAFIVIVAALLRATTLTAEDTTTIQRQITASPTPTVAPAYDPNGAGVVPGTPVAPIVDSGPADETLTFDIDFKGGTPQQLLTIIAKARGVPVNAVVPTEHADVQLPPVKMHGITVSSLFAALSRASHKTIKYPIGYGANKSVSYGSRTVGYGFEKMGAPSNPVWAFSYEGAEETPRESEVCRVWQVEPYIRNYSRNGGEQPLYRIEDITTAVQTAWDLLNIKKQPTLKFHPETKLLIAVGRSDDLQIIDEVLERLFSTLPHLPAAEAPAPPAAPTPPTPPAAPKAPKPPTAPQPPKPDAGPDSK